MIAKKQRLDQILFNRKLAESKTKAQAMILAGQVFVEGKIINKSGFNINSNAAIEIKNLGPKWVSRGANKLLTALEKNKIIVKNKICIDLGSSTGGFTDVLIQRGAEKVYAVDVGKNQLHEKLKKHTRVVSLEKTNARYLSKDKINQFINDGHIRITYLNGNVNDNDGCSSIGVIEAGWECEDLSVTSGGNTLL